MTVSAVPADIAAKLADPIYTRPAGPDAGRALDALGAGGHPLLKGFFESYVGSFWSENMGVELMDLMLGTETIQTSTEVCRRKFGFPSQFIVLSTYSAGQVVVLDVNTDEVFNVDFEGGDRMLIEGELEPQWASFEAFLRDFFCGR
jgi:hypothetical protein